MKNRQVEISWKELMQGGGRFYMKRVKRDEGCGSKILMLFMIRNRTTTAYPIRQTIHLVKQKRNLNEVIIRSQDNMANDRLLFLVPYCWMQTIMAQCKKKIKLMG